MNSSSSVTIADEAALRANCAGDPPLSARLEPWMCEFLGSEMIAQAVTEFDSPLNIICTSPMVRNIGEIRSKADSHGLRSKIFFARKSNKCLVFIDEAIRCDAGLDTASENELRQCLDRGVSPANIICTAAVKSDSLIDCCVSHQVCIAIDNRDELNAVVNRSRSLGKTAKIALRIGGFMHEDTCRRIPVSNAEHSQVGSQRHIKKLATRFGFDAVTDTDIVESLSGLPVDVQGIHFHLDGYDAGQRGTGIVNALQWIALLRAAGHTPTFIDIGGGFPISYLEDAHQWESFWQQHEQALLGERNPITYRNHGLGLLVHEGQVLGKRNSYPYYRATVRGDWLATILDNSFNGKSIADLIRNADVELRCEPGRCLMDGCGMTVARVEFCKRNADGDWLIGLSMNRTQCRTSSDDFLVDPIHIPTSRGTSESKTGFLVGAYCTESEMISLRKLTFPNGVERGDLIAFPNTAGYLMHFLESRSHQLPLAKNVVIGEGQQSVSLDGIDC
ncbi:Y4yA family PLP-dependent enzyme [Rubripirellula reticaptiva]|uniref:Biosynthetic arginine decarboxylase n=1 Tax=Rubripirellula reticaptiva TaxID=2528013 RepID=A0A5C6EFJ5_9BACT|nr:Y4yA family PLP-dependent enzyme [Rubripirellula reticaptiva]TWU46807.1 Biosynthetic arginine decarboxylase [Rubripirellula reticaptiva]